MTHGVIDRRRSEQAALVETARRWAAKAGPMVGAEAIVVVGSVARGDFNKWSDIDVLVVAPGLPATLAERLRLLKPTQRPPGVEAVVWEPAELARRRRGGTDPLARDAYRQGIVVYGRLPADVGRLKPPG